MRFQLLATVLACSAAFASFGAKASNPTPFDGGYIIEVLPNNTADHSKPSCVVFDPALGDFGIRTHRWNSAPTRLCGLGDMAAHAANKQAIWDITPVKHTDGRSAYVIRSRYNGKCLIRSNNGFNVSPSLHMWKATNPHLCGLDTEDAVIDNGQAAWVFGDTPEGAPETQVSSIAASRHGPAYLSFASANVGLRGTQTMLSVDNAFRLSCMPETCTQHRHHQIIYSKGYAFSRAVRVMDAAYLELPHAVWIPTEGFGNTSEQYVTVLPEHAQLYCTRLRTGGFSDWRVPKASELPEITSPKGHTLNQLWTRFGWPTGSLLYQTSLHRTLTGLGPVVGGERLTGETPGWISVNSTAPVSCVR